MNLEGKRIIKVEENRHRSAFTLVGLTLYFDDGSSVHIWAVNRNLHLDFSMEKPKESEKR